MVVDQALIYLKQATANKQKKKKVNPNH